MAEPISIYETDPDKINAKRLKMMAEITSHHSEHLPELSVEMVDRDYFYLTEGEQVINRGSYKETYAFLSAINHERTRIK